LFTTSYLHASTLAHYSQISLNNTDHQVLNLWSSCQIECCCC